MECCVSLDSVRSQSCSSVRVLSTDGVRNSLQTKRAKFIKRKGSQTHLSQGKNGSMSAQKNNLLAYSAQKSSEMLFGGLQCVSSENLPPTQKCKRALQIFKIEIFAEVTDYKGVLHRVVLLPEQILPLKTQRGRPVDLFTLPKAILLPLVNSEGLLCLKIRFEKECSLTACANYLQSKIDRFVESRQHHDHEAFRTTFLHENLLNGPQLHKAMEVFDIPGDLALETVKALVSRDSQHKHHDVARDQAFAQADPGRRTEGTNMPSFQTPARKAPSTVHKMISLKNVALSQSHETSAPAFSNVQTDIKKNLGARLKYESACVDTPQ